MSLEKNQPSIENFNQLEKKYLEEKIETTESVRQDIGNLVNDKLFRQAHDENVMMNYDKMLKGEGYVKLNDFKMLQSTLKFMEKEKDWYEDFNNKINLKIDSAIRSKHIAIKDVEFYKNQIAEHIFNGKQNVDQSILEKAIKDFDKSLESRKEEREKFDLIAHHKLAKEGSLQYGKDKKLAIPDEKGYLKMTVPERRKFLKEAEKALKEAEAYGKISEGVEAPKLEKEYTNLLTSAQQSEKIIGQASVNKYIKAFQELKDPEEKKYWIEEMKNGNQLERYRNLWADVRENLKGSALQKIESFREKFGYSQLFTMLGQIKASEKVRLDGNYQQKLYEARTNKWISKETMRSFMEDEDGIKNQDLKDKYNYVEQLPMQMARYKALRMQIDNLKDKQAQKELNDMYEQEGQGFTEINDRYEELTNPNYVSESKEDEKNTSALDSITDPTRKEGIIGAVELLDTTDKKKKMLDILNRMIDGSQEHLFNARSFKDDAFDLQLAKNKKSKATTEKVANNNKESGDVVMFNKITERRKQQAQKPKRGLFSRFLEKRNEENAAENNNAAISLQDQLKKRRQEASVEDTRETHTTKEPREILRKDVNRPVDNDAIDEAMGMAGENENMNTFQEEGYMRIEQQETGRRVVKVGLNGQKDVDNLMRENDKRAFQGSKDAGMEGRDHIHFTVYRDNGQEIELELNELRAMQKYLQGQLETQKMAA